MTDTNKISNIIETLAKCEDIDNAKEYYNDLLDYREKLLNNANFTKLSKTIEVFSHYDRVLLLRILMEKDRCVCELEAILDKSQSAISYHLKKLEELDLIRGWKKGKFTHYSVVEEKIKEFRELIINWVDLNVVKSNPNKF